ncbi:GIY-YIG nuclease family protein [Streptomyces sp. NPDC086989]|uniref:GIY-YIG nuclease family protein n=1 Tax=Streptomyces sp. NPDC086989 TaxID=3365764 RepID=UPI0038159802
MTSSTPEGDSYVYVIGSAGSTRVKIGTSIIPEKRLKELQTGNPDRLEVLWQTPGGRDLEAHLHQAFAAYRAGGEWFDFGDEPPLGPIPTAVYQHSGTKTARSRPGAAPKRAATRSEHLITPERLAGIVRDVVINVIRPEPHEASEVARPEPEQQEDNQEEPLVKKRRTAGEDMNRLVAFLYQDAAAGAAQRIISGKRGPDALGGWRILACVIFLAIISLPVSAFLMLRIIARDIWPIRKLPILFGAGYWLWGPLGFDKLIRDFVLSRLPMAEIEIFVRTYFTQAAVTGFYFLLCCSPVACLMGYAILIQDQMKEQREEAEAEGNLKTARHQVAQHPATAEDGDLPPGGRRGLPAPSPVAALIQSIPQQAAAPRTGSNPTLPPADT